MRNELKWIASVLGAAILFFIIFFILISHFTE